MTQFVYMYAETETGVHNYELRTVLYARSSCGRKAV